MGLWGKRPYAKYLIIMISYAFMALLGDKSMSDERIARTEIKQRDFSLKTETSFHYHDKGLK